MNSNQTANSLEKKKIDPEKFEELFKTVCKAAFQNKNNYEVKQDDELKLEDLYEIKINEKNIEIGPEKKAIHFQGTVVVRYKNTGSGYFHVRLNQVRQELLKKLPIPKIHLKVNFIKPVFKDASNYAVKDKFADGAQQPGGKKVRSVTDRFPLPTDGESSVGGKNERPPARRGRPPKIPRLEE